MLPAYILQGQMVTTHNRKGRIVLPAYILQGQVVTTHCREGMIVLTATTEPDGYQIFPDYRLYNINDTNI